MPTRNVVLSDHQQKLVETLVQSGRYQNASEVLREDSPWWPLREAVQARANASQQNATPTEAFARQLLAAIQRKNHPLRVRIGKGSRALPLLAALLPKRLLMRVLQRRFALNKRLG